MKDEIDRRASYTAAVLDQGTFTSRLWAKVAKSDGCWLWTGSLNNHGYGQIFRGDGPGETRLLMAHRAVWTLENGPIPEGMYLCHTCDNPACVRPSHMFLGKQIDNMRDCLGKGRMKFAPPRCGTANHNAKLTWESVRYIRREYALGVSIAVLSREIGVARSTLGAVVKGRCWREHGIECQPRQKPTQKIPTDHHAIIAARRAWGESTKSIAAEYGVTSGQISRIAPVRNRRPGELGSVRPARS